MAKYDQGGGCPCGLQRECDCEKTPEEERQRVLIRLKEEQKEQVDKVRS